MGRIVAPPTHSGNGKLEERCTPEKNIVKRERGVETERAEDCVVVHRVQMMSAKLLVFTPPLSALGPIWVFHYRAPLHGLYMVARMLQAS